MNVILLAGGPVNELPDFSLWPESLYIGVDAGTMTLIEMGIKPAAAVGDFDSVSEEQLAKIKKKLPRLEQAPADKDKTDTEMALEKAMSFAPATVIITGVTGGRLDHYMSALHAVFSFHMKYPETCFLIVNKQNRIRFLEAGSHTVHSDSRYRYVSFYPFTEEVKNFYLEGFIYEVSDETIPFGSTRFTSNRLEHAGVVSFSEGHCIMIESSDMQ